MPTPRCVYMLVALSVCQLLIILIVVVIKEEPAFPSNVISSHTNDNEKGHEDDDDDDDGGDFKALEALLEAESSVTSHDDQTTTTTNHNNHNNNHNKNNDDNNTKCLSLDSDDDRTDRSHTSGHFNVYLFDLVKRILAWIEQIFLHDSGDDADDGRNDHLLHREQEQQQPLCNHSRSRLIGPLPVHHILTFKDSLTTLKNLKKGGKWSPRNCKSSQNVVVIVPYRNRTDHLKQFLRYLHWFLQWQKVDYRIVVVQQTGSAMFNRGMLMNIGFAEVRRLQHVDCAIFHDVDLLPENDKNLYRCGGMPKHMSVAVSSFKYKLPYVNLFGGVESFQADQFVSINGFSNTYFGWGGEDDDLYKRVYLHRMEVSRDKEGVARYYMLNHHVQPRNPTRYELLKLSTSRFNTDGLNSLMYRCVHIEERPLYTWILVNLDYMYEKLSRKTTSNF